MKKTVIILADPDGKYLEALEIKFVETFRERMELIVITDENYFSAFFSSQKEADVLLIGEAFYTEQLQKHNIQKIIVLCEHKELFIGKDNVVLADKFANVKNIVNEAVYGLDAQYSGDGTSFTGTRIITVGSAIGGAGTTTIAMGLARCLANQHKRVLYLNTETVQSFSYYLTDKTRLDTDACRLLRDASRNHYEDVRAYVREDGFYFLPPFLVPLDALQIPGDMFMKLAAHARASENYDYIVLDTDNACRPETAAFMALSDFVLIVVRQDRFSVEKTNFLLRNMDCSDKDKFLFVCNGFVADADNAIGMLDFEGNFISEYIELLKEPLTLDTVSQNERVKSLMYMLL